MKRTTIVLLAGALAAGFYLGTPDSAGATPAAPAPICADWQARGATGSYPDVTFGGKPAGTEISASTAKLTKPASGVAPGVEFASFDLGVGPLAQEAIVHVQYATSGGASTSAGAIRMFAYYVKDADTLNDAPDHVDVAQAESGNLLFTVPAGKKIGTLGLVFDASNNTQGAVTFSSMTVGNRPVSFTACPQPSSSSTTSPTPTAPTTGPSVPASPSVTASASATDKEWTCAMFDTKAEAQAAFEQDREGLAELDADGDGYACEYRPDTDGTAGGLPVTGPSIGFVVMAALAGIAAGLSLLVLVRRRRMTFTP